MVRTKQATIGGGGGTGAVKGNASSKVVASKDSCVATTVESTPPLDKSSTGPGDGGPSSSNPVESVAVDSEAFAVDSETVAVESKPILTKSQKKSLQKKIRNKAKKREAEALALKGKAVLPVDPLEEERLEFIKSVKETLSKLPVVSELPTNEAILASDEQHVLLDELISEIVERRDELCLNCPRPRLRHWTSQFLIKELEEVRKTNDSLMAEREAELVQDLTLVQTYENGKHAAVTFNELKALAEERQKTNRKHSDIARAKQRQQRQFDKLKELKSDPALPPKDVIFIEMELSPSVIEALAPPNILIRRIERVYEVVIERVPNRPRFVLLIGLRPDIDALDELFKYGDFSGSSSIVLDPKLMPGFVGRGGIGIRTLEESTSCFVVTRQNVVLLYGLEENIAKAREAIKVSTNLQRSSNDVATSDIKIACAATCRAMYTKFSSFLHDTEVKNGVTTRVVLPQFESNSTNVYSCVRVGGHISIRGKTAKDVDTAKKEISAFVGTLHCHRIPGETSDLNLLFSRIGGGSKSDTRRALTAADKFSLLEEESSLAFLKYADCLAVVGAEAEVEGVLESCREMLKAVSHTSTRYTVSSEKAFVLTPEATTFIELDTNCTLRKQKFTSDGLPIEILGSDEDKLLAIEKLEKLVEEEAHVEEISLEDTDTISILTRDSRALLREIENGWNCRVSLDRKSLCCRIVGNKIGIPDAIKALQQIDSRQSELKSNQVVREIKLSDPNVIRRIIGNKGASIHALTEESGVKKIDIDDKALIVFIRGTEEATLKCEGLLKEIIIRHSLTSPAAAAAAPVKPPIIQTTKNEVDDFPILGEASPEMKRIGRKKFSSKVAEKIR